MGGATASAGRHRTHNADFHDTATVLSQLRPAHWLVQIASLFSLNTGLFLSLSSLAPVNRSVSAIGLIGLSQLLAVCLTALSCPVMFSPIKDHSA